MQGASLSKSADDTKLGEVLDTTRWWLSHREELPQADGNLVRLNKERSTGTNKMQKILFKHRKNLRCEGAQTLKRLPGEAAKSLSWKTPKTSS